MLIDRYYETIDQLYAKIKETQRENEIQAGKLIAESVKNGGCVHIFDTGHIINSELVERGGGLMLYKPFKYHLSVEDPVRPRDRSGINTSMEGLAAYALRASGALPGDVMIIGFGLRQDTQRDRSGSRGQEVWTQGDCPHLSGLLLPGKIRTFQRQTAV